MSDNTLGGRLRRLREQAGLSRTELGDAVGVSEGAVGHYETNRREPSNTTIERMANVLGTTPAYLAFGIQAGEGVHQNVEGLYAPKRRVPLISWVQAGNWAEAIDPNGVGEGEPVTTDLIISHSSFALRVVGDSMEPDFPEGTILIVDPEKAPTPKAFVIVRLTRSNEATFKQLVTDAGRQYLKPLNPRYPMLELSDDAVMCGVVVEARWSKKLS